MEDKGTDKVGECACRWQKTLRENAVGKLFESLKVVYVATAVQRRVIANQYEEATGGRRFSRASQYLPYQMHSHYHYLSISLCPLASAHSAT